MSMIVADSLDLPLFQAAAEAEHLHKEWATAFEAGDRKTEEFLRGSSVTWLEKIAATPAQTIEGALLKLRLVAEIIEGGTSDRDLPMLTDAIAVIERLTGKKARL